MTAKIIKGSDAAKGVKPANHDVDISGAQGGIVHKRVQDAHGQAAQIIADAEEDASKIRDEAAKVLEDSNIRRKEEIAKGFAEGETKGLATVTEKLVELNVLKERFYDQAEPEVIKLVMEIAEKVIGRLAIENADFINGVVKQALEKALGDRITVRLNPEDYKSVMSGEGQFRDVVDRTRRLLFREDDSISMGGCIVETEVGTIDARIETQLGAIRKALGL